MVCTLAVSLFVLQTRNLNSGPYADYDGRRAVSLWLPLVKDEATCDFASCLATTNRTLRELRNRVGARIVRTDMDHVSGTTVEGLAKKLRTAIIEAIGEEAKAGSPLETFLLAEGIVDWVRSHIVYANMLTPGRLAALGGMTLDQERTYRSQFWTPKTLLQKGELCAVCAGYSRLAHHLAKAIGVPLYNVRGYTRGALQVNGTHTTNPVNHSWNILAVKGASGRVLLLSTDPTQSRVALSEARAKGFDWYSPYSFPDNPDDAVFFHYAQRFTEVEDFKDKVVEFQPMTNSEAQWREMGSIAVLDRYRGAALRPTKSATTDIAPK